jgi:uncharacterized protein (DUF927 family)
MNDDLPDHSRRRPDDNATPERDTDSQRREHCAVLPPWDAVRPNFSHPQHGRPSGIWAYEDSAGNLHSYVARYDPPGERKQIVPYTYWEDSAGGKWQRKAWPKPRPLFGLDKLAARPDAPILVTEGEKAAVGLDGRGGAAALLPGYVCITSSGGARAARSSDWSPVADRDVVIWPDADEAGSEYAKNVARLAHKAGARSVRIVEVADLPDGFDLGDEIPPNLDVELRVQRARECGRHISFGGFTMDPVEGLWVKIGEGDKAESHFVSGPFEVIGRVRTSCGEQWARVLRFNDEDGRIHDATVTDAELHGDLKTISANLAAQGLKVSTGKGRAHLSHYLNGVRCDRRITMVDRTGWQEIDDRRAFVLPDRAIGAPTSSLVLRNQRETPYAVRGSISDWQNGVGRLACGHSRLVFVVSIAFAGPLLKLVDLDGAGFHFFGDSSIGKTAAAAAVASIFGRGGVPGFVRSWRATANAIEIAACLHTDVVLVLDEIGLIDAKDAAAAAYQLAMGIGKGRMSKDILGRPVSTWRTTVFSTGEISLADKLRESGQRPMAGQSVRLIDVPADAGKGFGLFDDPGETGSAKDLADAIKIEASTHYGTAGPAFVERVMKNVGEVQAALKDFIATFREDNLPSQADGQVQRAADCFGLVAAAGELAIEFRIVPWSPSSAYTAACECFEAFLDRRGGFDRAEERYAIGHVRRFIEAHGESRFVKTDGDSPSSRVVLNRAGFRRGKGEGEEWWVLPESWKEEICAGLDATQVARILAGRGMLVRDPKGFTTVKRVEGRPTRVYVLTSKVLAGEANE